MEKKTRSRLGLICKIVGAVYFGMILALYIWFAITALPVGMIGDALGTMLVQLVPVIATTVLMWGVGTLLDRQKEDRQALRDIQAALGVKPGPADEEESLVELEARLEAALSEEPGEDGDEAPPDPESPDKT